MAHELEMRIEGAEELLKLMRSLPPRLTKKHLKRATRQSAAMVRDEARRRAPILTGRLKRNIRSKGRRGGRTFAKASVFVNVGERTQIREWGGQFMATSKHFRTNPKDAFYWRFVERGYRAKNGRAMPPRPFIRPATEVKFKAVVRHIIKETNDGIAEEMKKNGVKKRER